MPAASSCSSKRLRSMRARRRLRADTQQSLGWVAANASREQAYEQLNAAVPDDIK